MNTRPLALAVVAAAIAFGAHLGSASSAGSPQQNGMNIAHTNLKTGDMAPDFTLLDNHWKQVHLSDFRGKKNVVLAFYVLAFTEG